jgi:hypothetical protein
MDQVLYWFAAAGVSMFVLVPMVAALNQRRLRRRERELGRRRKVKLRL